MNELTTPLSLNTTFCGVKLQSPFILSSGPATYGSEGMIRAHQLGVGAQVTKTIRISRAINPYATLAKSVKPR